MNKTMMLREQSVNLGKGTLLRSWTGTFALVAVTVVLLASPLAAQQFVYVNNNSSPNAVSAFSLSPAGVLTAVPGGPFATGGNGGVCFDIDSVSIRVVGPYLYATNSVKIGRAHV